MLSFVSFPENEQHQIASRLQYWWRWRLLSLEGWCWGMASIYQGRPKKQGTAVYLSLEGRAREDARGISINDLKKNDDVE